MVNKAGTVSNGNNFYCPRAHVASTMDMAYLLHTHFSWTVGVQQ
jgi:hypothetical protein